MRANRAQSELIELRSKVARLEFRSAADEMRLNRLNSCAIDSAARERNLRNALVDTDARDLLRIRDTSSSAMARGVVDKSLTLATMHAAMVMAHERHATQQERLPLRN